MKVSIAWNSKSYSDELLGSSKTVLRLDEEVFQIWLAVWSFVKSENRIMPLGELATVPQSQISASETCRLAQAQQGILRRLFRGNRNDIEQEASLTSFPREIPSLLRDGCSEFCRLMRRAICMLADVCPLHCQNLLTGRSAEGSNVALWGEFVLFSNHVIWRPNQHLTIRKYAF